MSAGIDRKGELESYAAGRLGAVLLDRDLTVIAVADNTLELSGHDAASLVGQSALAVVHPDDLERAGDALFEAMSAAGPSAEGMYRLRFADETYHEFGVIATCLGPSRDNETVFQFGPVPELLRTGEFVRDTVDTMRMLAESHELNEYLERVHRLAERHMLGSFLDITTFDDAGEARTHRRSIGSDSFTTRPTDSELPEHVELALAQYRSGPWRAFHRMSLFEAFSSHGRVTSVLTDDAGELLGYVEAHRPTAAEPDDNQWLVHGLVQQVLTIVLGRVQLDKQLLRAADLDPLTGLSNRRRLFADMDAADDLAQSSVLLIDLDRFSWINNTLGHHRGDQALVDLATTLRTVCPSRATIARFGGDEFVIWLPAGLADAAQIAEAVRERRPAQSTGDDEVLPIHCSIGVVTVRADESATDAIKRADEAMYIAKRRGGDAVHVVSEAGR